MKNDKDCVAEKFMDMFDFHYYIQFFIHVEVILSQNQVSVKS